MNRPRLAVSARGDKLVAKTNANTPEIGPEAARERDQNGVLASQISIAQGLPCLPSIEGRWLEEGKWVQGTLTPWQSGCRTLVEFPASRLTNPDQAVALVIWREFLGDGDANATNYLVRESTGQIMAIDLDKAFMGIFPIKSSAFQEILRLYATPARVEPVLYKISQLTDEKLILLLDQLGPKWNRSWSPMKREKLLQHLVRNRDLLTRENPYAHYYSLSAPWFVPLREEITESAGDSRVQEPPNR
jgi:hypothetical protein